MLLVLKFLLQLTHLAQSCSMEECLALNSKLDRAGKGMDEMMVREQGEGGHE